MRGALFLLLWLLALVQPASAIVDGVPAPREPSFVSNEVIVGYKQGQSPEELRTLVAKREYERKTFLGFFRLLFADFHMQLQKKESPENKLKRLEEVDKKAGVLSRERIFKETADANLRNTYLLNLTQGSDVLKAVALYKDLAEVAFAEPNYIRTIRNTR